MRADKKTLIGSLSAAALLSFPMRAQAVDIAPGTTIQSVVDVNPPNTSYVLKAGVHRMQNISPHNGDTFTGETGTILNGSKLLTSFSQQGSLWVATGQTQQGPVSAFPCISGHDRCNYPEDLFFDNVPLVHVASLAQVGPGKWFFDYPSATIYFADNPAGHSVETSVTLDAFTGGASNVTIQKLIIEKYAEPGQSAAINCGAAWILQNNEIRLNHAAGVWTNDTVQVLNNYVHHNGQIGIEGPGNNILLSGNEIAFNNDLGFDWQWEAGGTKITNSNGLIVRGNNSHDNHGPGLWTDINNINCLYENNVLTNNQGPGIMHEISYACTIRNNTATSNGMNLGGLWQGGAGIFVTASQDVDVYGNTLSGTGIGLMDAGRPGHTLSNVNVHNNTVTMTLESNGAVSNFPSTFSTANNRFDYNTYYLPDLSGISFAWQGDLNASQWQASGQDVHGTFVVAGSLSPCDLNKDGLTNVTDVQLEINQALGTTPCTNDINKDSVCNVIDVQRVANAALGGQCVSP